ncbi:MAG: EAL domain-containing protein, partial [Clostridia bacterium]|nr:EAL domain-containing protein [Clostridia bacterium]
AADFITKPYGAPDVVRARVRHSIELAEDSIIIHETERDSLTGLFNKEFFFEYGKRLDNQNHHIPMDAIVLDINRFHIVNELYGREYGDLILKKIGDSIHELVRQTGGLACRSGSNSFCIYIPHSPELEELLPEYTAKIDSIMGERKISVRMGIYSDDGSVTDMEHRFDGARVACQKLRNSYSTCYDFYNAELHSKELRSEKLINDIDTALAENQFKLYFQPKYNIKGDKPILVSAEALVRWIHPEFGMVGPAEFISLFENNGLIHKLDRYVWSEAAAQISRWKDKYGIVLPVSVNVSRVDVFDPLLGDILCEITNSNGILPEDLLLEITESAYTDNSQQIVDTVSSLRDKDFKVEMDDFGSGYSSLNMLTSLPIDALKLDMEFISNITSSSKDYELVKIMIEIARLINVPIIAEGVETKEQMDMLKAIGCDVIQGYYFSKPVPAEEFDRLIEAQIKEDNHDHC